MIVVVQNTENKDKAAEKVAKQYPGFFNTLLSEEKLSGTTEDGRKVESKNYWFAVADQVL